MVEPEGPQMTIHCGREEMRFSKTKTRIRKHAVIFNTYCFSMATLVSLKAPQYYVICTLPFVLSLVWISDETAAFFPYSIN